MSFKVAVVQDSPVLFNLHSTIEKVELLTKKAAKEEAKLIVFPRHLSQRILKAWTLVPELGVEL